MNRKNNLRMGGDIFSLLKCYIFVYGLQYIYTSCKRMQRLFISILHEIVISRKIKLDKGEVYKNGRGNHDKSRG
ncbi:hypothetical protein A7L45_08670 [Clostridium estertheticum subsp. estertheticum]|uniref:Uncharacterized protein n=1 Tax=Clostridium estertheticum subsp. estertheticum TaxID=1552 RepID=A0A1J0GGN8_9CLOT|nr:hypothetical protein A7L45_08670 [Clostridium estertheticum subsp. estertheticum]